MPPYHQRSAALRPYQPGGHSRRALRAALALDAVAPEHDVSRHERAIAAQRVRGLSDRVAQGNRSRAVGHDTVERGVAGNHLVRAPAMPVHRDHDADLAAETLHVAVERAPETGGVVGVLGHDRVDQHERAR